MVCWTTEGEQRISVTLLDKNGVHTVEFVGDAALRPQMSELLDSGVEIVLMLPPGREDVAIFAKAPGGEHKKLGRCLNDPAQLRKAVADMIVRGIWKEVLQ